MIIAPHRLHSNCSSLLRVVDFSGIGVGDRSAPKPVSAPSSK
jgi:hypothetical protein